VAIASQASGLATVLVLAPLIGGDPTAADFAWGFVAGISGGLAILALYQGTAASLIGIVIPVAAIGTGTFPAVFAFVIGERPGALVVVGLIVGAVALWLLGGAEEHLDAGSVRAGLVFGLLAGAGFGGFLIGLSRIGDDAGIWPLLTTRLAGVTVLVLLAIVAGHALQPPGRAWRSLVPAGSLGVIGNTFFLFAATEGTLAIASIIGSLFPAFSVILAWLILDERHGRMRLLGLALALVAVALIAAG
jgi:drug/metabolite transporter (DMT)-like permease